MSGNDNYGASGLSLQLNSDLALKKFFRMPLSTEIGAFSIINVAIGMISIVLQFAALMFFLNGVQLSTSYNLDVIGAGIWCGALYVFAGGSGIVASDKPKKSTLTLTLLAALISILGAIVVISLSCYSASAGYSTEFDNDIFFTDNFCYFYYNQPKCDKWVSLEWCLAAFSVLAGINNFLIIGLTTIPLVRKTYVHL